MLQRIEEWANGQLLNVIELEVPDPVQQPLGPTGALATLLVVQGVLPINDAANAIGVTANDLVLEAQAWAVAQTNE